MACLAGVPASAVLAFSIRNLTDASAASETISPSLTGQLLPGLLCASASQLGPAAADSAASSAASSEPYIAIAFDIAVSVAALGRARALQTAEDPLGLAGVLGGGPMPAILSPLQRTVLQAIVTLSAGLQLPALSSDGATPDSPFGGQMRPWLAALGSPKVDAWAVQLLLNGIAYYNLNGTNMLALRAAVAAVPSAAPLAADGGIESGSASGLSMAAVAGGAGAAFVLVAVLAAAILLLRRRRRARARPAALSAPSSRTVVSPLATLSGSAARKSDGADDDDRLRVNPLHKASLGASADKSDSSIAHAAAPSSRIPVSALSPSSGGAKGRARARADDGAGLTVNPLHKAAEAAASAADASLNAEGAEIPRVTYSPLAGVGTVRELAAARAVAGTDGSAIPMLMPRGGPGVTPGNVASSSGGDDDGRKDKRKSTLAAFFTPKAATKDRVVMVPQVVAEPADGDGGRASKARGMALMHDDSSDAAKARGIALKHQASTRVGFGGEHANSNRGDTGNGAVADTQGEEGGGIGVQGDRAASSNDAPEDDSDL